MGKDRFHFDTRVIHSGNHPDKWQGATLPPIYQTASHSYASADDLSQVFAGEKQGHIYMRLTNPTNNVLEEKICSLESGKGAVVMSSGMAAVSNTCMALLRAGDEFVAGDALFVSTYLLFTNIFKKYNITVKLVDLEDLDALEKAVNSRTRFVYLETIGNPKMDVPNISRVAAIAHKKDTALVVDNTLATPYLCRPLELGADAVLHSTTKYISGHGAAIGGVVVDGGRFAWPAAKYPDFQPFIDRKGELALLDKIWREHHINFGTTQAPLHAYLTMIGLDTLALRMERHLANAKAVAQFLTQRSEVKWVNFPGLKQHASYQTAREQFGGRGFGAMMTFGLKDQAACTRFIDKLELICHLANLGDCKTLVIHPYSTQYVSFDEERKDALGIKPEMIRLSIGIEAAEDIMDDLGQALSG